MHISPDKNVGRHPYLSIKYPASSDDANAPNISEAMGSPIDIFFGKPKIGWYISFINNGINDMDM